MSKNIITSIRRPGVKLAEHKVTPPAILLPLGRKDGVGQIMGCLVGKFMVKGIKGKDYFVSMTAGDFGPKKLGFFAKMCGKKEAPKAVEATPA